MMLDFARHYEQGPVHLSDVAAREKISIKYLEQLIIPLKREGLIKSMRGPKGGYILNKAPGEITFAQIIRILENASNLTDCVENPEVCEKSEECPTREVWVQTNRSMYEQLDTVSLADKL